jgi:hypothetical protein
MRNRLGQTQAACAALSQSLEYDRKALEQETGVLKSGARARYGC